MASVTKKEVVQAINDINDLLGFDTPIQATEDMSVAALTAAIAEKQEGEDAFVADDFRPGKKNSLTIDTVKILKRLKIKIPAVWEKRLGSEVEEEDVPNPAIEVEKKASKSAEVKGKTVASKGKKVMEDVKENEPVEKEAKEKPAKVAGKRGRAPSDKPARIIEIIKNAGKSIRGKDIMTELGSKEYNLLKKMVADGMVKRTDLEYSL